MAIQVDDLQDRWSVQSFYDCVSELNNHCRTLLTAPIFGVLGKLYYYKKQCQFGDPNEEVCGVINIQADLVGLLRSDEIAATSIITWPEAADNKAGFGLRVRTGRIYYMLAPSITEMKPWLVAFEAVGANIVFSEYQLQLQTPSKSGESAEHVQAVRDQVQKLRITQRSASSPMLIKKPSVATDIASPPAVGFAHRVVGGVVIRTEKN
jgi:hypothetical protein